MKRFYDEGDFVSGAFAEKVKRGEEVDSNEAYGKFVVLKAELRSLREIGDAACWGVAPVAFWYLWKGVRAVLG